MTAAAMAVITSASASTIDFSNLTGANGAAYTGSSEAGFEVTPTSGSWQQGQIFGNPTASIFSRSPTASIQVTGTGNFSFSSVDLSSGNAGFAAGSYTITGFLGSVQVFSFGGNSVPYGFATYSDPYSGAVINQLDITMNLGSSTSYNLDNIVLAPAAVPDARGTAFLLCLALAGLGFLGHQHRPRVSA